MDRSTMKQLGILIAALVIATVLILLLINYLAPATAADAIEQRSHSEDAFIVMGIQERLVDLGYPVRIDGAMGPETVEAIKAFQSDHGMTADGKVSGRLFVVLNRRPENQQVKDWVDLKNNCKDC